MPRVGVVGAEIGNQGDRGRVGQFGFAQAALAGQRVPGREDVDAGLFKEDLVFEALVATEVADERHVACAREEAGGGLADREAAQGDVDVGGMLGEAVEDLRGELIGGRSDEAEAQVAGAPQADRARLRGRRLQSIQRRAGLPSQRLPGGVNATRRVERSNSPTSRSRSRRAMWWLSVDCTMDRRAAARPKCSSSASTRNDRSRRGSGSKGHDIGSLGSLQNIDQRLADHHFPRAADRGTFGPMSSPSSARPAVLVVEAYLAAIGRGEPAQATALMSEDLVYIAPGVNALAGITDGQDAAGRWFGGMAARSGATYGLTAVLDWLDDDDHALLLAAESGTIDGRDHRWTRAILFDVTDGRIARVQLFEDDQHAYDAWVGGDSGDRGAVDPEEPAPSAGAAPAMAGRLGDPRVKAVLAYQHAVAAGDLDSARQVFHPDVTYTVAGDSALTGTYRGPDAVMGYLGRLMELTRGTYAISRMRWVTSPDRVGLLTRNHAERDGKRLSWDELIVFEFVDGRKKRISHFSGDQQSIDELLPR